MNKEKGIYKNLFNSEKEQRKDFKILGYKKQNKKKYKPNKRTIAYILAASLGVAGLAEYYKNSVNYATTSSDKKIAVLNEDGTVKDEIEGSIIAINGGINLETYEIVYISPEGEEKTGRILKSALDGIKTSRIHNSVLEDYNKIYKISEDTNFYKNKKDITEYQVIPAETMVLGKEENNPEIGFLNVYYFDEEGYQKGQVETKYLEELGNFENYSQKYMSLGKILEKKVISQSVEIRKEKNFESEIKGNINEASKIIVHNNKREENGELWSYIETDDGTKGWIPTDYIVGLNDEILTNNPEEKSVEDSNNNDEIVEIENNKSEKRIIKNPETKEYYGKKAIVGIDVSGMSGNDLRNMLQNKKGISKKTKRNNKEVDTSNLAGKINYVIIRVGYSGYGKGDIKVKEDENYLEQIKVCEELGVPYGLYHYSTAITLEELEKEKEQNRKSIEKAKKEGKLNNFLLGITYDFEFAKPGVDRTENIDRTQIVSECVKDGNTIYVAGNLIGKDIHLDEVRDTTEEKPNIWLPVSTDKNCNIHNVSMKHIKKIQKDANIVMLQVVLDAEDKYDINVMDPQYYNKLIRENTDKDVTSKAKNILKKIFSQDKEHE